MILWEIPKNCPYCGRFLKKTTEPILKVDGTDSGATRTLYSCGNKSVDHSHEMGD